MTHFNTNLRLPVRTGPSPMEDAIVQQVEWYMGRLNLEKDEYLKGQMDDDLWVSLDVILNFPKMQRMGVQDKRRVATLLHARSTIVEVDEKAARIRPAWARRSTIVIREVPSGVGFDHVAGLFQIPSKADISNAVPPTVSHPPGLISIQQAAETVWLAIFDSPTGAQESLHLLLDKEINGQKVNPEIHVENALRPQSGAYRQAEAQQHPNVYQNARPVDSTQQSSAPYAQVNPIMSAGMLTNQMLNPMGMPMPVIHHPSQETHPQYTYGPPPTAYATGYPPQNLSVPRQFMGAPRAMPAGYVMTYSQASHPYDPSHAVPMQPHPVRTQQQQVDQNVAPIMTSTPISVEGATTSQAIQTVPSMPNGGAPTPAPGETAERVEASAEFAQDSSISQVQVDAQRIASQIPFTGPVQIPVMTGQPVDGQMMMTSQVKPVDMHYMHRPQVMSDPNAYGRGNGRQQGIGRDRSGQRNADGSVKVSGRGPIMDGQRGSAMHRKGKKGNRGNTRHGHGHDRDRRDGKGDGSGSDSNRDDRRYEKSKPEPNLASMHFPPLPMSENAGGRVMPKGVKKDEVDDNAAAPTPDAQEAAEQSADDIPTRTDPTKAEATRSEGETGSPNSEVSGKDRGVEDLVKAKDFLPSDEANTTASEEADMKEDAPTASEDKKSEQKAPPPPAAPMSYAAILRSKKPGPLPRPTQPPVSRSSSGASGKTGDSNSGNEGNASSGSHPPKEKSSRRRKSNNQRNSHTGDTKDGNNNSSKSNGVQTEKPTDKNMNETSGTNESKDANLSGGENVRSKPAVENTRAHPVWVNKPKSLFQAASAAPTVRPSTPHVPIDSKKASSPVLSQGDEKDVLPEKNAKDSVDRNVPNGQLNGTISAGPVLEEATDVDTNGAVEAKDAPEAPTLKTVNPTSKTSTDGAKYGKAVKTAEKAANVSAKGAWAAGGPKTWPKNNANGMMEKPSNTSES